MIELLCCHVTQHNYTFLRVLQFKFIYNDNHTTNLLYCGVALKIYTILHCPKGYSLGMLLKAYQFHRPHFACAPS